VDKSFQLIRTNPRLTTNLKLVVSSDYNLYLESFDSNKELSDEKYKHYLLNRDAYIENEVPKFYDKLPKNLAFSVRDEQDVDVMYNEYNFQFDNIYFAGANEVNDKWYKEEFEYLAPLYIKKNELPEKFIILRVDESAVYENVDGEYTISNLSKDNFRKEIINKWKCVNVFDLTDNTNMGKFFDRNINQNDRFPEFSFFFDTKKYNYSKWSGIDYDTGVYKTSEMFLDDKLYYENHHFNLEEFITNGFQENGLIYPYILNMKFLFDDDPATPTEFKKWSMNRYYGFYSDKLDLVYRLTSYNLPELKENLVIKNNIFLIDKKHVNPFVIESTKEQWIQVDNSFYKVKLQSNGAYKIISDKNLTDYDTTEFNKGECIIRYSDNRNYIDIELDFIDPFINTNGINSDMYADIYLININGLYHILRKDDIGYYIDTDYAIYSDDKILKYWKGGEDNKYSVQKSIIQDDGTILTYDIYRVQITEIKDFDFDRINTDYAKFDYEKSNYVDTPEPKLYAKEYRDNSTPIRYKTHDIGEDGQYKIKNISSEYTAGDEVFELRDSAITPIFQKNQTVCKWQYNGSISHSDYPYKLNNNQEYGGTYNRTTNPNTNISNIEEKTLDYFYRIGEFYGKSIDDLYVGFDQYFETYWSGDTSVDGAADWNYDTGNNWLFVDDTTVGNTGVYMEFIEKLIPNNLYYIKLSGTTGTSGATYEMGVDPTSFPNGVSSNTGSINISFIARSLSDTLKLFVKDGNVRIHTFEINEIENKYYLNQSTNIQTGIHVKLDPNSDNRFNLNHYIDSGFDYFEFFFNNIMHYEDYGKLYTKPYLKYSTFNGGDGDLPATTLFNGIEYNLYTIEDMVLNLPEGLDETIRNIITNGGAKYNGYKFSTILSENYQEYSFEKDGNDFINPTFIATKNTSINGVSELNNSDKNGIHIFVNDKFKNVLIIINQVIPINIEWNSLNNTNVFGENYGLYYGKTKDELYNIFPVTGTTIKEYRPDDLTSYYYVNTLNNLNVKNVYESFVSYYFIDEDGGYAKTEMIKFNNSTFNDGQIKDWSNKFPPFYVDTEISSDINIKKRSYDVYPLRGPNTNIYDKYLVYADNIPLTSSYIDQPLSRTIVLNDKDDTINKVTHGETLYSSKIISRFIGYHEPLFKNISLFKPRYYWYNSGTTSYQCIDGNYVFGDNLYQFGTINELMYSKVNEDGNFLKLKDTDTERSYYPMVDEIGISQTDRFIFLSSWDKNFYIKTLNEQTLLDNYIEIPEQIIQTPTYAQIVSTTTPLVETYGYGVKIYGNSFGGGQPKIDVSANIKNLSEATKSILVGVKYISNSLSTDIIMTGYTSILSTGEVGTITFNIDRPNEIQSGVQTYEEYTEWKVVFYCYNESNDELDNNDSLNINVYNDLINFSLLNATVENDWIGEHITAEQYDFGITVTETNGYLSNIHTNITLYIEDDISGYWYARNGEYYVGQTSIESLNNVTLDRISLGIDWGETVYRNAKYKISHEYQIENTFPVIENTFIQSSPQLKITSEQEDPDLQWNHIAPTTSINAGECVPNTINGTFTGDEFEIDNIQIFNDGGTFQGNLEYNLVLYWKYSTDTTWIATTITQTEYKNSITIDAGTTYTINDVKLPRTYTSSLPVITWENRDYKTIISVTNVTGTKNSPTINGTIPNGESLFSYYICYNKTILIPDPPPSCLDENSIITLYDGTEKALKYLMEGEKVLSYMIDGNLTEQDKWTGNIKNGEYSISTVKNIIKKKVKGYNVINDGLIKSTTGHVIMVYDNINNIWKWDNVSKVKIGDKLFTKENGIVTVTNNIYLDAYINIVGIDVEDVDNYFVNGVLNHNVDAKE
jgi:hypothetical protein